MNIKPIETVYNGFRFRSRLEARWAVFFDELRLAYEYELEGYELPGGLRYLPDFWLPEIGVHVEVKPNLDISRNDLEKIVRFSCDGGKDLLLIAGSPSTEQMFLLNRRTADGWSFFERMEGYESFEQQREEFFSIVHDWSSVQFAEVPMRPGAIGLAYRIQSPNFAYALSGALLKAKQARFEHGKTPKAQ